MPQKRQESEESSQIPETSLFCASCEKWRPVDPQFKGVAVNEDGQATYVTTCRQCRTDMIKTDENRRNAHQADIDEAGGDAQAPVKCKFAALSSRFQNLSVQCAPAS
ncbi:hypothetical protein BC940DRAFT_319691 [Gongronella butleri]|nr:hypothetical protein BC940DRAFT_319691 [Gongronella butleri]